MELPKKSAEKENQLKEMELSINKIINGDSLEVLKELPDESIDSIITSPPY